MFGVNAAPEIIQRRLEELFAACPNALNYIEINENDHDRGVKEVKKIEIIIFSSMRKNVFGRHTK